MPTLKIANPIAATPHLLTLDTDDEAPEDANDADVETLPVAVDEYGDVVVAVTASV